MGKVRRNGPERSKRYNLTKCPPILENAVISQIFYNQALKYKNIFLPSLRLCAAFLFLKMRVLVRADSMNNGVILAFTCLFLKGSDFPCKSSSPYIHFSPFVLGILLISL